MHTRKTFAIFITAVLVVGMLTAASGCSSPKPTPTQRPSPLPSSPLDAPLQQAESPLAPPSQGTDIPGPAFAIDEPLKAGAERITGQGPANIPIVVVDVALTGEQLGQGFIDEQGRFDIEVAPPLVAGHRIGLMAGATSPMTPAEAEAYIAQLSRWKGPGARSLLHIGLLFATALVEE